MGAAAAFGPAPRARLDHERRVVDVDPARHRPRRGRRAQQAAEYDNTSGDGAVSVKSKDATKLAKKTQKNGGHSTMPHRDPPPRRRRPPKESDAATDYDAPRTGEDHSGVDTLEELEARRAGDHAATIDEEDLIAADEFELPGADLSGEELTIAVVPKQADEFVCTRCFLVHHRSQLASDAAGQPVCSECAA
jgi:hypothetical protein